MRDKFIMFSSVGPGMEQLCVWTRARIVALGVIFLKSVTKFKAHP